VRTIADFGRERRRQKRCLPGPRRWDRARAAKL